MIYWYTGQPGHGKTLCAIARALEFKAQGRRVFVCNVRDFDYEKTGCEKLTPDQFRNWMQELPDGAVCLVDEAYEHGMLPKRAPSQKVPEHVECLATHRHRGLDFIFVCQSPDKQIDGFVHDLIERHIHVRRRFGTKFQHLREFDRFERQPEKATPLVIKRQRLPKHVFGLYKSTELDTTERRIPWYFIALAVGIPLGLGFMYYTFGGIGDRWGSGGKALAATPPGAAANGAQAPVAADTDQSPESAWEYVQRYQPRIPSQPWSAPAYDDIAVSSEAPRLFCMAGNAGEAADGTAKEESCTCLTEQGTRYRGVSLRLCQMIAKDGQYEPRYSERDSEKVDGDAQARQHETNIRNNETERIVMESAQVHGYGDFRPEREEATQ